MDTTAIFMTATVRKTLMKSRRRIEVTAVREPEQFQHCSRGFEVFTHKKKRKDGFECMLQQLSSFLAEHGGTWRNHDWSEGCSV